jgi:hypothetical protein
MTVQPVTKEAQISESLRDAILAMRRHGDISASEKARIEIELHSLSKTDRKHADLLWVELYLIDANIEKIKQHLINAQHLNAAAFDLDRKRITVCANLLHATEGLTIFQRTVKIGDNDLLSMLSFAPMLGAFNFSKNIYEWAMQNMPIEAKNTSLGEFLGFADRLASLGVDDQVCASLLDLAGEVLWDEKLFWLDRQPKASIYDDCVRLDFSVDVSPKKAAELSWAHGSKVIARNLDHVPFFIGFRGVGA